MIKNCLINSIIKRLLTNKKISFDLVNRKLGFYGIKITKEVFDKHIKDLILDNKVKINPNDVEVYTQMWTKEACAKYSDKLFVFGDNTQRNGTGGQAVIRKCINSIGVATKFLPSTAEDAFFSDKDYIAIKPIIDRDILEIKLKFFTNNYDKLVLGKDGYGTGYAKLYEKAPLIFQYLNKRLKEEFNFDNAGSIHKITKKNGI